MRAEGWLTVLTTCVLATACVSSSVTVCGERVCPADSTCDEAAGLCIPLGCGDGEITGTEECDGANLDGRDCTHYGYYTAGTLGCSVVCTFDETTCEDAGICGDHVVNGAEACDGAPPEFRACTDFGFDIGRLGCNDACSPAFDHCDSVGWHVTATDEVTPWRGIWGASESFIVAVGDYGRIYRFDGTTWTTGTSSTMAQLNHVWGSSMTDIFAVGVGGTIVHFDGTGWTTMTSGTTVALRGVWGRGPNDVYAVGDQGTILHFNGVVWAVDGQFPPHDLQAVYGNADRVIVVGGATGPNIAKAKLLRKETSGGGWQNDVPPTIPNVTQPDGKYTLLSLWGNGNDFIAAGGEFGLNNGRSVMLTYNGAWTAHPLDAFGEVQAVFGTSPTDAILAGHNGLVMRWDGTKAFRVIIDSSRAFSELWGLSTRRLWASSYGGAIFTTDGLEWRAPFKASALPRDLSDVFRYPNGDLLIGGFGSQVLTVVDGVAQAPEIVSTRDITAVWSSGAEPGTGLTFVATEGDGVWGRGGNAAFEKEFDGFILDVFGLSETNVYAVGGTVNVPIVQRYTGTGWVPATIPQGTGLRPQAVWASGPNDVFVVGNAGIIIHSTDGTTFTQMQSGVDPSIVLRAVWGTGPDDVFVTGDNGTILHYDGTAWQRMTFAGSEVLLSLAGTSPHDVYASGTGSLLHYDGISWSPMELPVVFNTTGAVADERGIVFTGFLGEILQLDRVCQPREQQCGDAWDNDCDGEINCADTDCANTQACRRGGACTLEPTAIGCNESRRITTFTGVSRKDEWACVATSLGGSETTLYLDAPASGQVTFEISEVEGEAQLLVLDADTVDTACDVSSCQAATNGSVTKTASGSPMFAVVDAPAGSGAELTLSVSCN